MSKSMASTPAGTIAPALETRALVKRFGGLTATDQVSLQLLPGEIHALIGPNGAGKTTLIGQITGELRSDSGKVLISGRDVTRLSVAQRSRRGLGRSYQITQFCPQFTALENVAMGALARSGSAFPGWRPLHHELALIARAHAALEQVGLGAQAHTIAAVLSHGEHRQLELAMALSLQPHILLLDEPLAGMSGAESETMVELLAGLRGSYPVLLVEHDMNAVFALADRISVLVYGRVIASGRPEEIRSNPEVRSAYLGDEELIA